MFSPYLTYYLFPFFHFFFCYFLVAVTRSIIVTIFLVRIFHYVKVGKTLVLLMAVSQAGGDDYKCCISRSHSLRHRRKIGKGRGQKGNREKRDKSVPGGTDLKYVSFVEHPRLCRVI